MIFEWCNLFFFPFHNGKKNNIINISSKISSFDKYHWFTQHVQIKVYITCFFFLYSLIKVIFTCRFIYEIIKSIKNVIKTRWYTARDLIGRRGNSKWTQITFDKDDINEHISKLKWSGRQIRWITVHYTLQQEPKHK